MVDPGETRNGNHATVNAVIEAAPLFEATPHVWSEIFIFFNTIC